MYSEPVKHTYHRLLFTGSVANQSVCVHSRQKQNARKRVGHGVYQSLVSTFKNMLQGDNFDELAIGGF